MAKFLALFLLGLTNVPAFAASYDRVVKCEGASGKSLSVFVSHEASYIPLPEKGGETDVTIGGAILEEGKLTEHQVYAELLNNPPPGLLSICRALPSGSTEMIRVSFLQKKVTIVRPKRGNESVSVCHPYINDLSLIEQLVKTKLDLVDIEPCTFTPHFGKKPELERWRSEERNDFVP